MKAVLLNNRYHILETLGRGGFGETYLTEDTHMPSRRKCVVKQLKPIVKQPQIPLWMKERFQREAAILEELGEGNEQIPRLYAYFSEDDKFYLVQEWIEGLTVDKYWEQEGNLHRDEVREILLQLLPVLDFVHSRHIIHRDIKPENIILKPEDRTPVLIDFGAVKEAMATQVNDDSDSMYSASIGTPGYMPSEQAAGRPVYSSDLYSLGLTAIFLLTGKSPNELETDPANGEILWHEHASNVDSQLMSVLDKSIRFHPRDRFTTAKEMLAALQPTSNSHSSTGGVTARIAPASKNSQANYLSSGNRSHTVAVDVPERSTPRRRNWLVNAALFTLIALGVGVGTFAAGFALVSNLLRPSPPTAEKPQIPQIRLPEAKPDIFVNLNLNKNKPEKNKPKTQHQDKQQQNAEASETEASDRTSAEIKLESEDSDPPEVEIAKEPKQKSVAEAKPETSSQRSPQPQPDTAINIPLITTGTSESQLVSTLGEPTSARQGWQANRRILVYRNVIPNLVNLTYQSDGGKIRQTDVALSQEVSLGAMQTTLAQLLGGNAPAGIKEKLRQVYSRQTNFSFFAVGNLEGKVQRDAKDRVTISVWETGFE